MPAGAKRRRLELELSGGSSRVADFALLATGFRPDLRRSRLLDQALLEAVALSDGYPWVGVDFQTTVPGLYALGALSARNQGPISRFVCGTLVYKRLLMPSLER